MSKSLTHSITSYLSRDEKSALVARAHHEQRTVAWVTRKAVIAYLADPATVNAVVADARPNLTSQEESEHDRK